MHVKSNLVYFLSNETITGRLQKRFVFNHKINSAKSPRANLNSWINTSKKNILHITVGLFQFHWFHEHK